MREKEVREKRIREWGKEKNKGEKGRKEEEKWGGKGGKRGQKMGERREKEVVYKKGIWGCLSLF